MIQVSPLLARSMLACRSQGHKEQGVARQLATAMGATTRILKVVFFVWAAFVSRAFDCVFSSARRALCTPPAKPQVAKIMTNHSNVMLFTPLLVLVLAKDLGSSTVVGTRGITLVLVVLDYYSCTVR